MLTYLLRRLGLAVITVFAITVVTFVILQLPPVDFVDCLCGAGGRLRNGDLGRPRRMRCVWPMG